MIFFTVYVVICTGRERVIFFTVYVVIRYMWLPVGGRERVHVVEVHAVTRQKANV